MVLTVPVGVSGLMVPVRQAEQVIPEEDMMCLKREIGRGCKGQ